MALKAAVLSPTLVCWRAHSARHCERAIAEGTCDFAVFDAADMLHAAYRHRLVPFMQEVCDSHQVALKAVAFSLLLCIFERLSKVKDTMELDIDFVLIPAFTPHFGG